MVTTLPQRPELLVVGTGVAGGLVAHRATQAGLRVTMLEAGPRLARKDLVRRFRTADDQTLMAPYPLVPHAPHPNTARTDDNLVQVGPHPYAQQYLRVLGGTTWHWGAATWRYLPADMELRSRYGVGRDWPISYDTLEPAYYKAEVALGVAGPEDAPYDAPRARPYPMPPAPFSYLDQVWHEKLTAAGYAVIHAPQCRNNQQVYDGRPPCCGNANCMPICPIGAHYSGNIHSEKAEAAGAEIITDAVVHFLEVDGEGRIVAARYLEPSGEEFRIEADLFVLAANGIEGPKIMLMSKQENAPGGVGNSSDQVGRNLMDHPGTSHSFGSAEPLWPGRGPNILSGIVNLRDGDFRSDYAARKLMPDNYPQDRRCRSLSHRGGPFGRGTARGRAPPRGAPAGGLFLQRTAPRSGEPDPSVREGDRQPRHPAPRDLVFHRRLRPPRRRGHPRPDRGDGDHVRRPPRGRDP
jgi:choline dehydrogenase-like flavoprotein